MITYDYRCQQCNTLVERYVHFNERDNQSCSACGLAMIRQMSAPMGRIAGRIPQGGGPDRFTADTLGIPLKELPLGLKADS